MPYKGWGPAYGGQPEPAFMRAWQGAKLNPYGNNLFESYYDPWSKSPMGMQIDIPAPTIYGPAYEDRNMRFVMPGRRTYGPDYGGSARGNLDGYGQVGVPSYVQGIKNRRTGRYQKSPLDWGSVNARRLRY